MSEYRVESGNVYKFDMEAGAYVFCGILNGMTLGEFLELEEFMEWDAE